MKRQAQLSRKTGETDIRVSLLIDGSGGRRIDTPIGFLTHLIETFAFHGKFDLELEARGDLQVDQHHLVEDTGLVLGRVFKEALGGGPSGIVRAGSFIMPMDDALALAAVDICGRPFLQYDLPFERRFCGELDTDVVEDFFRAFTNGLGANLAVKALSGRSDHHKVEAVFKAFARAMRAACAPDAAGEGEVPSLKGVIDK